MTTQRTCSDYLFASSLRADRARRAVRRFGLQRGWPPQHAARGCLQPAPFVLCGRHDGEERGGTAAAAAPAAQD